MSADTIYATSTGQPPAAIAIVRISGLFAQHAAIALTGSVPTPRLASLRDFRHPTSGEVLDRGLLLFFPGPGSATGEDLVELHLHGGRAVVAGVLDALSALSKLRSATPGEFTRRAFENGRIDLAEAEGLADLLAAETQSQKRAALTLAGGALSRKIDNWQELLLGLAAQVEALLDFSDEGDVEESWPVGWSDALAAMIAEVKTLLTAPAAERLRDGIRVVIAGPPNVGKSSLLNRIIGREAAITSPTAGTTRDVIEVPIALCGAPFVLIDTAGLRDSTDEIEATGVSLAHDRLQTADLVLWLGHPDDKPDADRTITVASKLDLFEAGTLPAADLRVSARTGEGIDQLLALLIRRSRNLLPPEGAVVINARHRAVLAEVLGLLRDAAKETDPVLVAEFLRLARQGLDRITGRAGVEDMLDNLFGAFCIGK